MRGALRIRVQPIHREAEDLGEAARLDGFTQSHGDHLRALYIGGFSESEACSASAQACNSSCTAIQTLHGKVWRVH